MIKADAIIKAQAWTYAGGVVLDGPNAYNEGTYIATVNKDQTTNGARRPIETDCLLYLLASAPDLYRALSEIVKEAQTVKGKPALFRAIDKAEKAPAKAQEWDSI